MQHLILIFLPESVAEYTRASEGKVGVTLNLSSNALYVRDTLLQTAVNAVITDSAPVQFVETNIKRDAKNKLTTAQSKKLFYECPDGRGEFRVVPWADVNAIIERAASVSPERRKDTDIVRRGFKERSSLYGTRPLLLFWC
jgi:hypothetical protein